MLASCAAATIGILYECGTLLDVEEKDANTDRSYRHSLFWTLAFPPTCAAHVTFSPLSSMRTHRYGFSLTHVLSASQERNPSGDENIRVTALILCLCFMLRKSKDSRGSGGNGSGRAPTCATATLPRRSSYSGTPCSDECTGGHGHNIQRRRRAKGDLTIVCRREAIGRKVFDCTTVGLHVASVCVAYLKQCR